MLQAEPWRPGPAQPPWPAGEVHLWWVDLCLVDADAQVLSADEHDRAARALSPTVRDRRVRSRGVLRDLLGRYLGLAPAAVVIDIGPAGKPCLPAAADGLGFNVSHSADLALIGVVAGRELGVDVQGADALRDPAAVARSSFSPREQAELQAMPAAQQHAAVLRGWVRKEAYGKARGQGYGRGFKTFSVPLAAAASALLVDDEQDPDAASGWHLADLPMPPSWPAACCVQGRPLPRRLWRWPPSPRGSTR